MKPWEGKRGWEVQNRPVQAGARIPDPRPRLPAPTPDVLTESQLWLLSKASGCAVQDQEEKCGNNYRTITGRCNNRWVPGATPDLGVPPFPHHPPLLRVVSRSTTLLT